MLPPSRLAPVARARAHAALPAVALGVLLSLASGCVTGISDVGIDESESRGYALPLLSTVFTLGDALGDYDFVGTLRDRDGLRLVRLDTTYRRSPIEAVILPQFQIPLLDTAIAVDAAVFGLNLPVRRVEFSAGTLEFTLANNQAMSVAVELTSINFERGGEPIVITRTLAPGERLTDRVDLAGATFRLGDPRVIRISYDARLPDGTRVRLGVATLQLLSYTAREATGSLDSLVVPLGRSSIRTEYLRDLVPNSASVRDARLRYTIISTLPTPLQLVARESYAALRNGTQFRFRTPIDDGIVVPAARFPGDTVRFSFDITPDNSELVAAVRMFPDSIVFDLVGIANPDGSATEVVVDAEDVVIGFYEFDVPLDVSFDGFVVQQEFALGGTDDLDGVRDARLRISSDNGIPVGARAAIYLLDSLGAIRDSFPELDIDLLRPADADPATGEVVSRVASSVEVPIPDRLFEALRDGDRGLVRLRLASDDPGRQFVRLRGEQTLGLQLGLTFTLEP